MFKIAVVFNLLVSVFFICSCSLGSKKPLIPAKIKNPIKESRELYLLGINDFHGAFLAKKNKKTGQKLGGAVQLSQSVEHFKNKYGKMQEIPGTEP